MKVLIPGHVYELAHIDGGETQELAFVNREEGSQREGTQVQEVLRALIDRTGYCDEKMAHDVNARIIQHLRMALVLFEVRALERKVEKGTMQPEHVEVWDGDGHFQFISHPK